MLHVSIEDVRIIISFPAEAGHHYEMIDIFRDVAKSVHWVHDHITQYGGDTYDVPAIIETAETRRRVHGLPQAKWALFEFVAEALK